MATIGKKSGVKPQVYPINIPNCCFVRKRMLENTMMAANIIQYCSKQVRHVQHILFVEKITVARFITLLSLFPFVYCLLRKLRLKMR